MYFDLITVSLRWVMIMITNTYVMLAMLPIITLSMIVLSNTSESSP